MPHRQQHDLVPIVYSSRPINHRPPSIWRDIAMWWLAFGLGAFAAYMLHLVP